MTKYSPKNVQDEGLRSQVCLYPKGRENYSAIVYLKLCGLREGFPIPLDAWDRLLYFIVALHVPFM